MNEKFISFLLVGINFKKQYFSNVFHLIFLLNEDNKMLIKFYLY